MANKPTKPIKVVTPATPTKDELMAKRLAYFAQRREGIATSILCGLMQGRAKGILKADYMEYVDLSIEMTDRLLEKLYPAPKPEGKK